MTPMLAALLGALAGLAVALVAWLASGTVRAVRRAYYRWRAGPEAVERMRRGMAIQAAMEAEAEAPEEEVDPEDYAKAAAETIGLVAPYEWAVRAWPVENQSLVVYVDQDKAPMMRRMLGALVYHLEHPWGEA